MIKTVKPLKVSPSIKAARWSLLFLGIFYGAQRMDILRETDKKQRPLREKQLKEKYERLAQEAREKSIVEIADVAKQFEVNEFPPGWSDDI